VILRHSTCCFCIVLYICYHNTNIIHICITCVSLKYLHRWVGYYNYSIDYCTKTNAAGNGDFPLGSYCILRYGGTCPNGLFVMRSTLNVVFSIGNIYKNIKNWRWPTRSLLAYQGYSQTLHLLVLISFASFVV